MQHEGILKVGAFNLRPYCLFFRTGDKLQNVHKHHPMAILSKVGIEQSRTLAFDD
jgi:hypothetical protein